jgi:hypothetical protein
MKLPTVVCYLEEERYASRALTRFSADPFFVLCFFLFLGADGPCLALYNYKPNRS